MVDICNSIIEIIINCNGKAQQNTE